MTVDCRDPAAVARFWNEALGWGGTAVAPDGSGALCGPASGGVYLEFVQVPEEQGRQEPGARRLHSREARARSTARSRASSRLGAVFAWEERFPPDVAARYRNVVLRDVEGNEFCLSGGRCGRDDQIAVGCLGWYSCISRPPGSSIIAMMP